MDFDNNVEKVQSGFRVTGAQITLAKPADNVIWAMN